MGIRNWGAWLQRPATFVRGGLVGLIRRLQTPLTLAAWIGREPNLFRKLPLAAVEPGPVFRDESCLVALQHETGQSSGCKCSRIDIDTI